MSQDNLLSAKIRIIDEKKETFRSERTDVGTRERAI